MKYVKPRSVAWWASISMLAAGGFLAFTPVHGLTDWAASVAAIYQNQSPAMLIQLGFLGIGLRGAVK